MCLMNQPPNKSSLTPDQTRLVELMQTLNFGRVEVLHVQNGQPVFSPPPKVIRKLKMGGENTSRAEAEYGDFRLKHGVIELLEIIARLSDGEVRLIEVRFGLPVTVEIEWAGMTDGSSDGSEILPARRSSPVL
jgi:hypothetical protein